MHESLRIAAPHFGEHPVPGLFRIKRKAPSYDGQKVRRFLIGVVVGTKPVFPDAGYCVAWPSTRGYVPARLARDRDSALRRGLACD